MRLFFAVPISGEIKDMIDRAISSFPVTDPPWRWIPSRNYHLTLRFLGDTDEDKIHSLEESAARVASATGSFDISFGEFGAFPHFRRPRVIFFRVEEGKEQLAELAGEMEEEMRKLGFEPERRKFRAHLTLARIKRSLPRAVKVKMESVAPLDSTVRQRVDHIDLMQSILGRGGAEYSRLSRFELRQGG